MWRRLPMIVLHLSCLPIEIFRSVVSPLSDMRERAWASGKCNLFFMNTEMCVFCFSSERNPLAEWKKKKENERKFHDSRANGIEFVCASACSRAKKNVSTRLRKWKEKRKFALMWTRAGGDGGDYSRAGIELSLKRIKEVIQDFISRQQQHNMRFGFSETHNSENV